MIGGFAGGFGTVMTSGTRASRDAAVVHSSRSPTGGAVASVAR
ncbi:MAG: hypothetical protein Q7T79_02460 [bacterium]|nr:hypothetical protein [bacterium]